MSLLYALIMAGGGGTRLWPESRAALPKQFIQLLDEKSLIQIAYDRITPLIPPERVLIVTGQRYTALVQEQLPDLPAENIIAEPSGRNTAPAIGLGAIHLRRRDPEATLAVLTADHIMHQEDTFRSALAAAHAAASEGRVVTLGITPAGSETGYGYIERGSGLSSFAGHNVFQVDSFREKPDLATAQEFVDSGRFFWNSGMFIWRVSTIMSEFKRQLPDTHAALEEMEASLGTAQATAVIGRVWPTIQPISIDYGVMEGAQNVAVLPVDPDWNDVGSWSAVYEEGLLTSEQSNVVQSGEHLAIDSSGCLIRSKKLVATVGIKDLIIVETDDALFICPRDQAQQVKELVNQLKVDQRNEYL